MAEAFSKKNYWRKRTFQNEISDWVKGVVAVMEPVAGFDHKAEYRKHVEGKYGK